MSKQKKRTQPEKMKLALCGEYAVAAEFCRHGILAIVTLGNHKEVDVVVLRENGTYLKVQVKTTDKKRFPTGLSQNKLNQREKNKIWVFVHAQRLNGDGKSRFYVLTDAEVKKVQRKFNQKYLAEYKNRHGRAYLKQGVPVIPLDMLTDFENKWHKVDSVLKDSAAG